MVHEVYRDDAVSLYRGRGVLIARWIGAPTMEQAVVLDTYASAAKGDDAPGFLNIILDIEGKPDFSAEFRTYATRVTGDPAWYPRFRAHVILLEGLGAIGIQMFVQTMLMVAKPPVPTAAFRDCDAACEWALPLLADAGWTSERLLQAMAQIIAVEAA